MQFARRFDDVKPRMLCLQPFDRSPQFWSLKDDLRKEVLNRHYSVIKKFEEEFDYQAIYTLGFSRTQFLQVFEFPFANLQKFHEFMNELVKDNAPYLQFGNVVTGITGSQDYRSFFGVRSLDELPEELRSRFVRKAEDSYLPPADITEEEVRKIAEHFKTTKGYGGDIWTYTYEIYGSRGFAEFKPPSLKKFHGPMMVAVQYCHRPPEWWALKEKERQAVMMKHAVILEKYNVKDVDRKLTFLLGTASPSFITMFEFPFENIPVFHDLMNEVMKIDSPYLIFDDAYTGVTGIDDYLMK